MNASRRRRPQNHQPQLPLRAPEDQSETGHDEEWRLDERTRQIGRRGVALARAQLSSTGGTVAAGVTGDTGGAGDGPTMRAGGDTGRQRGGRGPAGRAA